MDKKKSEYFKLSYLAVKISSLLLILFVWIIIGYFVFKVSWWILLILALPTHFLFEWIGGKLFAIKYGWSVSQVGFSLSRIIFGVLLVLILGLLFFFIIN